ncbi:MAG: methanogenesis marker 17 protein [Candidatus Methanomethylophilaceae archaeon]|nr:methanogenesis marker 17 protein [Candidatus Methanomethylophilaceae archaeon]
MKIEATGTDPYGCEAYKDLFRVIMSDIGKGILIDEARMMLRPEVPLFIFSVMLKAEPDNKTISDAASLRKEGDDVFITISDERYAPSILSQLWKRYTRARVDQQTRFDIVIEGADMDEVAAIEISSGEETKKEILGAIWRSMPEGIRVRFNQTDGRVLTIMATEEIVRPEMKEEARKMHAEMLAKAREAERHV